MNSQLNLRKLIIFAACPFICLAIIFCIFIAYQLSLSGGISEGFFQGLGSTAIIFLFVVAVLEIISLLYYKFGQGSSLKLWFWFAVIHLAVIIPLGVQTIIEFNVPELSEGATFVWLLPMMFDFPIFITTMFAVDSLFKDTSIVNLVIEPFIISGIAGTAQYALFGWLVEKYSKIK